MLCHEKPRCKRSLYGSIKSRYDCTPGEIRRWSQVCDSISSRDQVGAQNWPSRMPTILILQHVDFFASFDPHTAYRPLFTNINFYYHGGHILEVLGSSRSILPFYFFLARDLNDRTRQFLIHTRLLVFYGNSGLFCIYPFSVHWRSLTIIPPRALWPLIRCAIFPRENFLLLVHKPCLFQHLL